MKMGINKQVLFLATALLLNGAATRAAESYLVVKVVDRTDATTFEVMAPAELKTLQADIQTETRLMPKALALARKAWEKDAKNTKAFPMGAVNRRLAEPVGPPLKEQSTAADKAKHLTEAAALKAAEAADKAEQKFKDQYSGDKRKDKQAEAEAKESERRALDEKALALYEVQLATLKAPGAP